MQRNILVAVIAGAAVAAVALGAKSMIAPESNAPREASAPKVSTEHHAPARLRSYADVDTR